MARARSWDTPELSARAGQRTRRDWVVIACVALLVGGCGSPSPTEEADRALIAAVRAVAAEQMRAQDAAARVGRSATFSTEQGISVVMLDGVIEVDEQAPPETLDPKTAQHIVYWKRPLPGPRRRIVGLQWTENGPPKVFFGLR